MRKPQFFYIYLFLFLGNFLTPGLIFSQADSTSYQQCRTYATQIYSGSEDFIRYAYSDSLKSALDRFLGSADGLEYSFDSIPGFSAVMSADRKVFMYTWMIHRTDGNFDYNGCIVVHTSEKLKPRLTWLEDQSGLIPEPETKILSANQWYGCLVLEIIQAEEKNPAFYTLLGWDGNNGVSRKKIIDILSIKSNGNLVFGAPVFLKYGSKTKRVIFEYSAKTAFLLRYDYQTILYKKRKGKNVKVKEEQVNLIVFDRLQPLNPGMEGQFQFYYPETNVVDGFKWYNNKWLYIKEVDARNPEPENQIKRRKPQMGLSPEKEVKIKP